MQTVCELNKQIWQILLCACSFCLFHTARGDHLKSILCTLPNVQRGLFRYVVFIRRVIVVVVFSLVNTIFLYPLVRIYLGNRASCIDPPLFMYESNNVRWIPCKPIGFPTNTFFSSLNLSMLFVVCFFIWLSVYCHISACNENGAVITVLK